MKSLIKNNKIIIEFEFNEIDENIISLLSALEISKKSQASEKDILNISEKIKKEWWSKNKEKYLNDE